jgi:hypothetical protein
MSFHTPPSASSRETEAKQIDHNDSIRSTYFNIDALRECGEKLGKEGTPSLPGLMEFEFFKRHHENEKEILRVYRATATDVDAGASITPAAEWLLDNYYIVEEAIQEVRRDFPKKFFRQLPTMTVGGQELPRVLVLAWLYVAHTHSSVSREALASMVEGFQVKEPLEIGELWALPSFIRFVLIENLRRIATRVDRSRNMRRRANETADEIIRLNNEEASADVLKGIENLTNDNTFTAQFLYRLRNASQTSGFAVAWLEQRLEQAGTDVEEVMLAEQNRLSSGNVTMGNIIKSLREIDDTEWSVWFEDVSQIDKIFRLRTDYQALDFGSRNAYRNRIEQIARRSRKSEAEVAEAAIQLAEKAAAEENADPRETNVGAFVVGRRRRELEAAVGYDLLFVQKVCPACPPPQLVRDRRPGHPHYRSRDGDCRLVPGAGGYSAAGRLLLPADVCAAGFRRRNRPVQHAGDLCGAAGPAGRLRIQGRHSGSGKNARCRALPDHRPRHRGRARPQPRGPLSRQPAWRDLFLAAQRLARQQVRGDRYRPRNPRLCEARDRGAQRQVWRRRQGALLSAASPPSVQSRTKAHGWAGSASAASCMSSTCCCAAIATPAIFRAPTPCRPNVQYVMTLDADTRLMRDAVTKLVGKMHHPINQPVLDPKTNRVIHGYGLMQPRVTPSLTTGKEASVFQRVFSVGRGLDPYVFTVSDVYQDLTGEGSFTGKGLYHVDAFEASLKGRIDENSVLSHDLLEGSFARCALVTDVELVEDFPVRYEVEVSRQHRWARGDWQLLPYILDPKRGVTALGRWKMVDNLRRSLTPIAWFFASVLGWYFHGSARRARSGRSC